MDLTKQYTKDGIELAHPVLGKVATIKRETVGYYVFPYSFQPCDYGKTFKSMQAAECYAIALAHEMWDALPAWRSGSI